MACIKFHISFFLSVLNSCIQNIQFPRNQTHCTYVWRHKYIKAQGREDHVATRLPWLQKSRTHEQKNVN